MDYTDYPDYTTMVQQMTGFYKSAIDNSVNAMTMIQEGTEKIVNFYVEQSPWFPEEGRKIIDAWMKAYKKGHNDLKVAADEQYEKVEAVVNLQKKSRFRDIPPSKRK
jgi:polyhydroxyalkanoate synthesis regulator phasin